MASTKNVTSSIGVCYQSKQHKKLDKPYLKGRYHSRSTLLSVFWWRHLAHSLMSHVVMYNTRSQRPPVPCVNMASVERRSRVQFPYALCKWYVVTIYPWHTYVLCETFLAKMRMHCTTQRCLTQRCLLISSLSNRMQGLNKTTNL